MAICDLNIDTHSEEELDANGELIAETFNILLESGLTPKELLDRIAVLDAQLKKTAKSLSIATERTSGTLRLLLSDRKKEIDKLVHPK